MYNGNSYLKKKILYEIICNFWFNVLCVYIISYCISYYIKVYGYIL